MTEPWQCDDFPRHLPCVTVTNRLRDRWHTRWWIRCWGCELRLGPFERREDAEFIRRVIESNYDETPVQSLPDDEGLGTKAEVDLDDFDLALILGVCVFVAVVILLIN